MTQEDRILRIEKSIHDLEAVLHELKDELEDIKQGTPEPAQATVSAPSEEPAPKASAQIPEIPVTPAVTTAPQTAAAPAHTQAMPKKTSAGFEENLGGKVMGIVAAVLVFIGLFLFGSLLYERLGDSARIASLFIVSFLLLGSGLFFERKHKSWFTTSLTGCGFGAVYISLFITTLYFHLLSVEVLYLLLLLWLTGVGVYVFLRQSYVVASLGQAGIAFSVIFGCLGVESKGQFTFLCIYFTALSLLYLWLVLWRFLPKSKEKPYPWIQLVAAGLNLIQLWVLTANYDTLFGTYGHFGGKNPVGALLLCLYSLALPLFFLLRGRLSAGLSLLPKPRQSRSVTEKTLPVYKTGSTVSLFFAFYQIAVWIVFSVISGSLFEADIPQGLFLLTGLLLSYILSEVFGAVGTEGRGACIVNAFAVLFSLLIFDFPDVVHVLICVLFCGISLLFGLFGPEYPLQRKYDYDKKKWDSFCKEEKGRCVPKFTAYAYAFLLPFSYQSSDSFGLLCVIAVFGLLLFGGSFYFLYKNGKQQRFSDGWKMELYLLSFYYIFGITESLLLRTSLDSILQAAVLLSLLTLCNGIAYYSPFRKKICSPDLADNCTTVVIRIIHTLLWIWAIALLHSGAITDHPLLCVWLIVLSLYLCGSGMYEQYKTHRKETGLGIYFGLRVTFYFLTVLTAFDSIEGYVISCILLLLAVLAVLAGFPLHLAPLRVYGLCLAMFAVFKLLMIDVEHDNSMETVLCFLGAGILCFAINFIYNHVKKRFTNE